MSDSLLTPAQDKVLGFVREFIRENEYPPTRAEIAKAMGFRSANAAEEHLLALERKNKIRLKRGISRGIVVTGGLTA